MWKEIPLGGIFLGEESHMPQARLLSKEECQEDFSNPTKKSEAHGEEEYVNQYL
jgi:hypothetical protein